MMLVPWLLLAGFGSIAVASFWYLQLDLAALVSADSAHKMLHYAAGFFPPEIAPAFLARMFSPRRRGWRWPCPPPDALAGSCVRRRGCYSIFCVQSRNWSGRH